MRAARAIAGALLRVTPSPATSMAMLLCSAALIGGGLVTFAAMTDSQALGDNTFEVDALSRHLDVSAAGSDAQVSDPGTPVASGSGLTDLELDLGTTPAGHAYARAFKVVNPTDRAQTARLRTAGLPAQVASATFAGGASTRELPPGGEAWVIVTTSQLAAGTGSGSLRVAYDNSAENGGVDSTSRWMYAEFPVAVVNRPAPPAAVSAVAHADGDVTVSWDASPTAGVTAYRVLRRVGAGPLTQVAEVTGTTFRDADTSYGDRIVYVVRAVHGALESVDSPASGEVVAQGDVTPPAISLTLSGATGQTHVRDLIAFLNPQAGRSGSFTVGATATDSESGVARVAFPSPAGFGSGGGDDLTAPYSTTYAWSGTGPVTATHTVTAHDNAGLSRGADFRVVADTAAPAGGALSVAGVTAGSGGASGYSATGTYAGTRTDYSEAATDTASGLAVSDLTREAGSLAGDACTGFGAATTLAGAPSESGLATGCYRYRLTGTDRVQNAATVEATVKVDRAAPTAGLTAPAAGSTVARGNVTVSGSATDAQTGVASVRFEYRQGTTGAFTEIATDTTSPYEATWNTASLPAGGYELRMTATDRAGNTATDTRTVTVPSSCVPGQITLVADRDTTLDQAAPAADNGNGSTFAVGALRGNGTASERRAYGVVGFPAPSIPSGCSVTAAELRLGLSSLSWSNPATRTVTVQRISSAFTWTEATNWNSGLTVEAAPTATLSFTGSAATGTTYAFNVSALWSAGATNGFRLADFGSLTNNTSYRLDFWSSEESDAARRPRLVLTYG